MSIGLQYLNAVIHSGGASSFREVHEGLFQATELPAFQFVTSHYRRHGNLPDPSTLAENGYILPAAPETVQYYLDRVRTRAIYARIMEGRRILDGHIQTMDMAAAQDAVRELSRQLADVNVTHDVATLATVVQDVVIDYNQQHARGGLRGITLGFEPLDEVTAGAQPGDLIAVVGRPNIGKSWTLLYMAFRAWLLGHTALIISMEMSKEQIGRRWLAFVSGLNPDFIRRGHLSQRGESIMHNAVTNVVNGAQIHLLSGNFRKSTRNVDELMQEFNPDICYADAGYLLTPERKRGNSAGRRENISDVAEELKGVFVSRARPGVISVQFNRTQKPEEGKRGKRKELDLSGIAETDVIAQVATAAIGIRPGPNPRPTSTRQYELMKNRDGELVKWVGNFRFAPLNMDWMPNAQIDSGGLADASVDAPSQGWMVAVAGWAIPGLAAVVSLLNDVSGMIV